MFVKLLNSYIFFNDAQICIYFINILSMVMQKFPLFGNYCVPAS